MSTVQVNLPNTPYEIIIKNNLLNEIGVHISKLYNGKRISVITDSNVAKLYQNIVTSKLKEEGFSVEFFIIPAGESSKCFSVFESLTEELAARGHQRSDLILALGGGVVGDLAGFTASSFLRGVPFIQVPTSLLAQIDSSIGGKTGINIKAGKNLVGAIYQPKAVLIDPTTLDTLPLKYLRDGIGEAIKYGFIDRPDLLNIFEHSVLDSVSAQSDKMAGLPVAFQHVLQNRDEIIQICCESKRDFVLEDEKDFGKRMILNYGHTIGHAIEKIGQYTEYTHGEAVAMGMYYMQRVTEKHNMTDKGLTERIRVLLKKYDLYNEKMGAQADQWMHTIQKDKKNLNSTLNIITVKEPGKPVIHKTTSEEFKQMLKEGLA